MLVHTASQSNCIECSSTCATYAWGFIQDLLLGRGKKGYSCQHLIESHLIMHIAIEGPDLKEVNFNHILEDQNHCIAS